MFERFKRKMTEKDMKFKAVLIFPLECLDGQNAFLGTFNFDSNVLDVSHGRISNAYLENKKYFFAAC